MIQVYPSAQNDIPVAPSSGPVTYAPGIGEWVERYLAEVFQFLREQS